MGLRHIQAVVLALAMVVGPASAQGTTTQAHQSAPAVDLSAQTTRWSVDESWNDDQLTYTFYGDGRFESSTGNGGRWIQSGNRVVMDWPSYGAVYIGAMNGNRISGAGFYDNGRPVGSFVLTIEPPR